MNWRKIAEDDPARIAKLAGAALEADAHRLAAQKGVEALEAEVKEIKELLRLAFVKAGMTEVKTRLGMARLVPKTVYQADVPNDGWAKIWTYVVKTKAYDLLEKRLHQGACKARFEDGKKIPGVKTFEMVHVKLGDAE